MTATGEIQIRIKGNLDNTPLTPSNFDIRDIKDLLDVVSRLLESFHAGSNRRPVVSYEIRKGSVINVFRTNMQTVVSFMAVASLVQSSGSLDGLEANTAKCIQDLQKSAICKGYSYEISGSGHEGTALVIDSHSNLKINDAIWANTEIYLYGTLENAGGISKSNIHIRTKEYGTVIIEADREVLRQREENFLYRNFAIRAMGRVNVRSGEIDMTSLRLIDMTPFNPKFDSQYIKKLTTTASKRWSDVKDVDNWLNQIRYGNV